MKILLIGCGPMSSDYFKVLEHLKIETDIMIIKSNMVIKLKSQGNSCISNFMAITMSKKMFYI